MESRKKIKKQIILILSLVSAWRIILFLLAKFAQDVLPCKPSFPYSSSLLKSSELPQWVYSWANFDGVHYITLAKKGYVGTGLIQAFFPLYPVLVGYIASFEFSSIIAGLALSFLGLIGASFTLFHLVKRHFAHQIALWSVVALLLFPTSFYLAGMYTESLFLFFILQSFYWYERKKWVPLTICLYLSSATRLVGIALVPVLLLDVGVQNLHLTAKMRTVALSTSFATFWKYLKRILKNWSNNIRAVLSISLGSTGLLSYMTYLYVNFGDPLYFYHVQSEFGGGREERLVLLPQVIVRAIKIVTTVPASLLRTPIYAQELLAGTVSFVVLALLYKKVPTSWLIFSTIALLLPTTTGTFSSMPRYTLVAFPLFVGFGLLMTRHQKIAGILLLLSTILMVFNTILFIQGYWVA